jgi:hypothetical protein
MRSAEQDKERIKHIFEAIEIHSDSLRRSPLWQCEWQFLI